jgi:hypothetical protein
MSDVWIAHVCAEVNCGQPCFVRYQQRPDQLHAWRWRDFNVVTGRLIEGSEADADDGWAVTSCLKPTHRGPPVIFEIELGVLILDDATLTRGGIKNDHQRIASRKALKKTLADRSAPKNGTLLVQPRRGQLEMGILEQLEKPLCTFPVELHNPSEVGL